MTQLTFPPKFTAFLRLGDPCPYGCTDGIIGSFSINSDMFSCISGGGGGLQGFKMLSWHDFPDWKTPAPEPEPAPKDENEHYPMVCPKCKGPAYQGITPGSKWDCKYKCGV